MPEGIAQIRVGTSLQGRPILLHAAFAADDPDALARAGTGTLLIGGTHGDERATVSILETFVSTRMAAGRLGGAVAALCLHNPDGHEADTRYNSRGVDLNRNFSYRWSPSSEEPPGAGPLSEPESRALHDLIMKYRPRKIISLHWALAELDADGPQSTPLAERMWEALAPEERAPYRLRIQRPEQPATGFCPGSLGQWCGNHLAYPDGVRPAMVTLELPYHPGYDPRPDPLHPGHFDEVKALWRERPSEYLAGVEGPVLRMLEAACLHAHEWPPKAAGA
jgi:hypothetical protein